MFLWKDLIQKVCTYVARGFTSFFGIDSCFKGVFSGMILELLVVVLHSIFEGFFSGKILGLLVVVL